MPAGAQRVMIFADRDKPGHDNAVKAARILQISHEVSLRFPPVGCKDWNNALALNEAAE
jgi:hypothetical protein